MPGNREVYSAAINAADRHRWDSQWMEALREYQRALAEFPEDATARSGLGFCYMQLKQWQQALNEYEYILRRDPSNIIALSKTAELYGILNRREDAYQAYLHLADLYSQAGQGARAEAAWLKAVQLSPGNPEPHERLASYYFEKKDIAAMMQQRLAAAQGYLYRNELELARQQCEEVLRADNSNVQARQLLAQIQQGSGPPLGTAWPDSVSSAGPPAHMPQTTNSPFSQTTNSDHSVANTVSSGNTSGGNTGIMGNMGSAGNYGGVNNMASSAALTGSGGMPRRRITASQVTEALKQAQIFQDQGRYNEAIDLCEQILESGFDRPDARYFLGWLYQEQQRWDDAIRQFQMLLNDPDYALSCYYALGQCYRARGDLRTATVHFDEAVDRVNLDALTVEEADQLVQLCQEAAEAHRLLGEQEQALTVYNALLGFLRSRGWNDKVAQVEFMLQQAQNAPAPARPVTPPVTQNGSPMQGPPSQMPPQQPMADAATMMFNAPPQAPMPPQQPQQPQQPAANQANNNVGELPDWLTGILNEGEQPQMAAPQQPPMSPPQASVAEQPTMMQPSIGDQMAPQQSVPSQPLQAPQPEQQAAPSWLTEDIPPAAPNSTRVLPQDQFGGDIFGQPMQQPTPPPGQQPAVQQPTPPPGQQPTVQPMQQPAAPQSMQQPTPPPGQQPAMQSIPQQPTMPQQPAPAQPAAQQSSFLFEQPTPPPGQQPAMQQPVAPQPQQPTPPPGQQPAVQPMQQPVAPQPQQPTPPPGQQPVMPQGFPFEQQPQQPTPGQQPVMPQSFPLEQQPQQPTPPPGQQPAVQPMQQPVVAQQPVMPAPAEKSPVVSQPLQAAPTPADQVSLLLPNTPQEPQLSTLAGMIAGTASPQPETKPAEDLLSQLAGSTNTVQVEDAITASTYNLPENVRGRVAQSMRDIQNYVNHGLLTPAMEECLRVIEMAPQYLDVHQVLCEIYVRQGKIEQAITKYAILVDTYIVNGRTEDAIATYRRILQLEPNNLTYRMRLINLLSSHGNKEDLLRERTLAAEAYLRLGYMDRALTELEQALQESPTSVPTRLNYALALQKLGRSQQAMAEYQRVLQVDPRNITALVRLHIMQITALGTARSNSLELLSRIRWQLRGEGQKNANAVVREYLQAVDIYPNNADVHYSLGQIYQQCGLFDKAVDSYSLSLRDSSVEVLARVASAHCLLQQGKPEPAIQHLEQALQAARRSPVAIDPATWAARPREEGEEHKAPEVEISKLLADAYARTGRMEQRDALLRQLKQTRAAQDEVASTLAEISARQSDPETTLREYLELVNHYRSSRQGDNAIKVLNEMVRLAPQDPRAHEELAEIYINRGLLEEGIAELRLLADIYLRRNRSSDAALVLQRIASIYDEMGDNDEALANYCRAAELDPTSMDLMREVVGFCYRVGRSHEAARYQEAIARHYYETHQVKEAVAALQQLITIDRTNYDAYDMLGQTYQSVGEYEQASRVYRNLAKVNPGSTVARERLATLQELRSSSR
uniref:Tetratricopeptide repeat protein n=1 Tax=Thermosporothrix sp. COM3 TaxID=2490863 RepID=A0A455SQW8_9CHLR|nr:hypothetical protein KTC_42620 [Thermosporothrix sp. COM3]